MRYFILLFILCLSSLEAHKHRPHRYDININLTAAHEWIDFSIYHPEPEAYVLFHLQHMPKGINYPIIVGKLTYDDNTEILLSSDNMKLGLESVKSWMLLPQLRDGN